MPINTIDEQIKFCRALSPVIQLKVGKWSPDRILKDAQEIIQKFPFTEFNQLNLTVENETDSNPYQGLGRIEPKIENGINTSELNYKYFNSQFQHTVFFEIFQKLQSESPFPLGRVRLMRLNRNSCYSVHEDGSLRFHLPVVTNPETYFCFDYQGFHHVPADGRLYCTNTLIRHTVVNGGSKERIHLVFSTSWKDVPLDNVKAFLGQ